MNDSVAVLFSTPCYLGLLISSVYRSVKSDGCIGWEVKEGTGVDFFREEKIVPFQESWLQGFFLRNGKLISCISSL